MSDFRPTPSQRAAIEARDSALLVSAGAGSGKTRVLTERLMSYVCDDKRPVDLDSFLVISFTRAAAGELRGRISAELAARLALDPGNRRLRRQIALCQRAQIGTIHSFCAALLRENCHLLALSPDFRIADEERSEAMKTAALERVLEKRYDALPDYPGFSELADTVGAGRDDSRLMKLVLELHAKMQCHARPELWARRQVELLRASAEDVSQTPWGQEIMSWAKELCGYWAEEFDRLMAEMAANEKISAAYMESFSATAEELRELRRRLDLGWDSAAERRVIHFPKLGALRNSPDVELSEKLKARREVCKKAMPALEKALGSDSAALLAELRLTAPAMEALLSLTLDFDEAFSKSKRDKALVDYSDLEHLAARLLTGEDGSPTELARQLSLRYTEIMVDEYQDVSRVQDAIFRAVSRDGRNLFMVGDIKQSIYRFRLAEPEIFNDKYLSYADFDEASPPQPRRVLLRENFRSRREIIDGANSVFSLCMSRALGDMDYDEAAALRCGAAYSGSGERPRLTLLELPEGSDDEETPEKTALEAAYVADEIARLMASDIKVGAAGAERELQYGDIAILLRSANSIGGTYRRVLAEHGVPSSAVQGTGFFSSVEVSTLLSMLAVTDNPHQDIPLIAVLRSPALGFSADELSAIRAADRKHDFYTALTVAAETQPRCRDFLDMLSLLRETAPDLSAAELTWEIMERLDMLAICSAMDSGEQRRARLLELIELAESFESTGYRGLHRFVLWLRRLSEKGQEPSAAPSGSAVQIMSIHRSKGLEFPVVFLCDTARRFNRQDSRETVLVHPELGLGPKLTDLERRVEYPTLARNAIRLRLERELLSEELRLLYVAMTRARERLYMTAAMKKPQKKLDALSAALSSPMPPQALRQAGSMADWLIWACLADGGESLELSQRPGISAGETVEAEPSSIEPNVPDDADAVELRRRLSYSYPHQSAVPLPSKVTATELKGRAERDGDAQYLEQPREYAFKLPDFASQNGPLAGAKRGVATHLVLQHMDFERASLPGGVEAEIGRLRRERFLSQREAEAVDAAAIEKLLHSSLGQRILTADRRIREFKFSLLWDAERVYPQVKDEELLMQGVVDCCIEEAGELTVIDYKTDRVRTPAETAARAEHYAGQLRVYAEAMERILGKPVKQCVLYFLSNGEAVAVALDRDPAPTCAGDDLIRRFAPPSP